MTLRLSNLALDPFGVSQTAQRSLTLLDTRVAFPPSQATRVFFVSLVAIGHPVQQR